MDISIVLYSDTQKQKKWYSVLVPTKKTINNNTHLHSNISSSIPIINEVIAYCHKTMPIKARIQDIINFLEKKKIKGLNENLFWSNSVFCATGYKILKLSNPRVFKKNPNRKKDLRPKKICDSRSN